MSVSFRQTPGELIEGQFQTVPILRKVNRYEDNELTKRKRFPLS